MKSRLASCFASSAELGASCVLLLLTPFAAEGGVASDIARVCKTKNYFWCLLCLLCCVRLGVRGELGTIQKSGGEIEVAGFTVCMSLKVFNSFNTMMKREREREIK